jgi:hypothetical protein
MAKRKAAKAAAGNDVESKVIVLAEQLGTFLGRVQKKADGWLENEALRKQVSDIRDRAEDLLKQVNMAGASMRKPAPPKRQSREGEAAPAKKAKAKTQPTSKGRSGGVVDAPGKRHRRPPPQELFDPRLGEPMGKQMGQKSLKRRGRG